MTAAFNSIRRGLRQAIAQQRFPWQHLPEWSLLDDKQQRELNDRLVPFIGWPRTVPAHAKALRDIRSAAKRLREAANALERVPHFTQMHCSLNSRVTPGILDAMADGLDADALTAPDAGPKTSDRLLWNYVSEIMKVVTGKHHDDIVAAVVGAILQRPITADAIKKSRHRAGKIRRTA